MLLVAASIVATDGGIATLDAGKKELLQPGDSGKAFYELLVDGTPKRIEVGTVVIASVNQETASLAPDPEISMRPGYRVEFRLPPERLNPPAPAPLKRPVPAPAVPEVSAPAVPESTSPPLPAEPDPLKRPVSVPAVPEVSAPAVPESTSPPLPAEPDTLKRPVSVPAVPAPQPAPRNTLTIPSGNYAIGLDPQEAQFFNQTPRHEVLIYAFAIDRYLVGRDQALSRGGSPITGVSFSDAEDRCSQLGLRLPTEQEWEIASQTPGFHLLTGFQEWTTSWYQGYPANSRSEEGYGETHKVLRGSEDGSTDSLFIRRFMDPDQRNSKVGFRCVRDLP